MGFGQRPVQTRSDKDTCQRLRSEKRSFDTNVAHELNNLIYINVYENEIDEMIINDN
jgi:hypothetical protein